MRGFLRRLLGLPHPAAEDARRGVDQRDAWITTTIGPTPRVLAPESATGRLAYADLDPTALRDRLEDRSQVRSALLAHLPFWVLIAQAVGILLGEFVLGLGVAPTLGAERPFERLAYAFLLFVLFVAMAGVTARATTGRARLATWTAYALLVMALATARRSSLLEEETVSVAPLLLHVALTVGAGLYGNYLTEELLVVRRLRLTLRDINSGVRRLERLQHAARQRLEQDDTNAARYDAQRARLAADYERHHFTKGEDV